MQCSDSGISTTTQFGNIVATLHADKIKSIVSNIETSINFIVYSSLVISKATNANDARIFQMISEMLIEIETKLNACLNLPAPAPLN